MPVYVSVYCGIIDTMPYLHIYWPVMVPGAIKSPGVTFVGPYHSSRAFKQTSPRSQSVTIIYRVAGCQARRTRRNGAHNCSATASQCVTAMETTIVVRRWFEVQQKRRLAETLCHQSRSYDPALLKWPFSHLCIEWKRKHDLLIPHETGFSQLLCPTQQYPGSTH